MTRWEEGDLKFPGDPNGEFEVAFKLLAQRQPDAARRKLLEILRDRLQERKNFQLYPSGN
jgi:hypothetical protein